MTITGIDLDLAVIILPSEPAKLLSFLLGCRLEANPSPKAAAAADLCWD